MATRTKTRHGSKGGRTFTVDQSDVFMGIIALLVAVLVYYAGNLGGNTETTGAANSGANNGSQANVVMAQRPNNNGGGSGTKFTDEPDALIMDKRNAGNDQQGSAPQQAKIDSIDGQKFSIGESLRGERLYPRNRPRGEHMIAFGPQSGHRMENAAADLLVDEAKKVRKDVKENQSGAALTRKLGSEFDDVKQAIKSENFRAPAQSAFQLQKREIAPSLQSGGHPFNAGTYPPGIQVGPNGVPVAPMVGGEPGLDPMDVFSEPIAEIQTRPNIDYTGFGHMHYTGGGEKQYDRVFYPTSGEMYTYLRQPLPYGKHRKYLGPDGDLTYDDMQRAQEQVQKERNKMGFARDVVGPLEMRIRFAKGKDFDNLASFNGYNTTKKEYVIGSELGDTGHTWKQESLPSGIKQQKSGGGGGGDGGGGGGGDAGKGGMYQVSGAKGGDGSIGGTGGMGSSPSLRGGAVGGGVISEESWEKNRADWNRIRVKVRGSVSKMLKLFDRVFSEELFPNAVADIKDDGTLLVTDGKDGKCILLGRYYEYVQNSIMTQLGLGKPDPMTWAKDVGLRFEDIEANKLPLRAALTEPCDQTKGYIVEDGGTIGSATGQKIEIVIPWPQDQSTLITHPLKLGKQMAV